VQLGWSAELFHVDPFRALDYKFRCLAKTLKSWIAKRIGSVRLQLAVAREVILRLDTAAEVHALSEDESGFVTNSSSNVLGLRR
jgi:hypothetical protein